MEDGYQEYDVFTVKDRNGNDVELAVVNEFEYDKKTYVAGARIEGDEIIEDGVFIYRARVEDGEIQAEPVTDPKEYDKVVQAYLEME